MRYRLHTSRYCALCGSTSHNISHCPWKHK